MFQIKPWVVKGKKRQALASLPHAVTTIIPQLVEMLEQKKKKKTGLMVISQSNDNIKRKFVISKLSLCNLNKDCNTRDITSPPRPVNPCRSRNMRSRTPRRPRTRTSRTPHMNDSSSRSAPSTSTIVG